ncbi:MAG: XRE family transcriptional regulator [Candidatus Eisenbacteria bacterium]|nr:XRE family transcriptional regulator [Candidatus Eisenbacteria bacterium]
MRAGASREGRKGSRAVIPVERSSGNVFEDLGLEESAERLVKSEIAARIASIIERRSLRQVQAAKLLGVHQADVSDLTRGKLAGFSTDRLFRFLTTLGQDVEIRMPSRLRANGHGRLRVLDEDGRSVAAGGMRGKR